MTPIAFFLFALLIPWVMGFAIIKPFLKQRYGYQAFAIGAGYVLGWFVTTLILRVYDYFQRPFELYEIVAIECIIAIPLLFLKARQCSIEELRLEKAPSNLSYFLAITIVVLLLYRFGLTAVDLLSKPVFPWDGWSSWSAKAKIFFYYKSIPSLSDVLTFWQFTDETMVSANGARHPYFISLIQTYTALCWGDWDDNIVNLPWWGLGLATVFVVYGSLRYLGIKMLPAILASYAAVSMPIWDIHISLGSYADIWVGASLFCSLCFLMFVLSYKERRLLFVFFIFCMITYLTKNTALIFVLSLLLVVIWHWLGWVWSIILLILGLGLYLVGHAWLDDELITYLRNLLSSGFNKKMLTYNPVEKLVWHEWFLMDNWHYLFLGGVVSVILFPLQKCRSDLYRLKLLVVSGVCLILLMLLLTLLTTKMSSLNFVAYFNRVSLYFVLVYALIPVSIYSLHRDD